MNGLKSGIGEQVTGGEEALAEVAGDDFFGVTDGGEVDAGVPAEKYIDVRRYMMQLGGGQDSRPLASCRRFGTTMGCGVSGRADEGLEQFGNAGGVHGKI
jgi:hypothetical protein